jgi:di/tricarboxylate transporter
MVLMPIAFGSLLGGMTTLIGTPPNLIISSYRARAVGEAYGMFDFAWVGGVVTAVVVAACGLVLWRFLPRREPTMSRDAMFEIERYVAELLVGEESKVVGERIAELGKRAEGEFLVIGIARGERQIRMPSLGERVMAGDVLIVEAEAETMKRVADAFGLEVSGDEKLREEFLTSGEVVLSECIVKADGLADGRTPAHLNLRLAFGVNLLGIARQGARVRSRVSQTRLRAGDVLLLQGDRDSMGRVLGTLGCLPLAERTLRLGQPRRVIAAVGLFLAAIACVVAGVLRVEVAFAACACVMVLAGLLSLREAYEAIDWPIIVLLAAMIPVGVAMETTGGAARVAEWMLGVGRSVPPWMAVALHMATCMALSNVINNAAAAVLMAPIAVGLSAGLGVSADPFLMATAIGASAAFLTPIGHQSNTLVMGPGGYRFTDYLRMGVPCTVLTLLVATPMILWRWPLEMVGVE